MADSKPDPRDERKPLSSRLRFEVLRRDDFTCNYCGARGPEGAQLTVDHVIPAALGGSDEPTNLVTACFDCNAGKGSTNLDSTQVAEISDEARAYAAALDRAAEIERASREDADGFTDEFLREVWHRWTFKAGPRAGQGLSLPPNWRAIILGYRRSGLTMADLRYGVDIAIGKGIGDDLETWRYFCGVSRKVLAKRHEIAQKLLETGE